MMEKEVKTLSVRQLANLFGRSEQTVRRWKDKGINGVKLLSGLNLEDEDAQTDDESRGGSLVFTVEAVRSFVDMNPNLLDDSAPELELILYGKKRGIFSRKRGEREPAVGALPESREYDTRRLAGPTGVAVKGKSRAIVADQGSYVLQLLQKRELEIQEELRLLNQELEQIRVEKARVLSGEHFDED